jgi:hypothetical protein
MWLFKNLGITSCTQDKTFMKQAPKDKMIRMSPIDKMKPVGKLLDAYFDPVTGQIAITAKMDKAIYPIFLDGKATIEANIKVHKKVIKKKTNAKSKTTKHN